jgi:hypothetical protein
MLMTYNGKHATVSVLIAGRAVVANCGDIVDVSEEIAAVLSDLPDWSSVAAPVIEADDETEEV